MMLMTIGDDEDGTDGEEPLARELPVRELLVKKLPVTRPRLLRLPTADDGTSRRPSQDTVRHHLVR